MRWDDWDAIEAAQAKADAADQERHTEPRPIDPEAAQAVQEAERIIAAPPTPSEPVLGHGTVTYTNASGQRVTEPIPPREPPDPVTGMRLYVKALRKLLS